MNNFKLFNCYLQTDGRLKRFINVEKNMSAHPIQLGKNQIIFGILAIIFNVSTCEVYRDTKWDYKNNLIRLIRLKNNNQH